MTIDIFQYSNIYTLDRPLRWLADDPTVQEECGPYVTKPGMADSSERVVNLFLIAVFFP